MGELVYSAVKRCIDKAGRSPYLFLGSGFSMRYAGSDTWEDLLRYLCTWIDDGAYTLEGYMAEAGARDGQDMPTVATLIERDLSKRVFREEAYREFREKHDALLRDGCAVSKIIAAERVGSFKPRLLQGEYEELRGLAARKVSGIITTNYDTIAEELFPGFEVFVGQDDLLFGTSFGIGEIYKIHGSITNPETMVLNAADYAVFEEKMDYLAAKLLTIFAEYPIIFIGYSLKDQNIRSLLKSLAKCVGPARLEYLRDRFIFVGRGDDGCSPFALSFDGVGDIVMTCVKTNDFGNVYRAIGDCEPKYAPRVLRQLRQSIYRLASQVNPDSPITVTGFEQIDAIPEGQDIVLGIASVGEHHHGHMVKAEQLYEDVVLDNQYIDPQLAVDEYLPTLLGSNSGGLPMYKYLSSCLPRALSPRVGEAINKRRTLDAFLNEQLRDQKKSFRAGRERLSVNLIIDEFGNQDAFKYIRFLDKDEIDTGDLKRYLAELICPNPDILKNNPELKRIIRIFDFLRYKDAADTSSNSETWYLT